MSENNYSKLITPKPYQSPSMSNKGSNTSRPPPPPPPPPLRSDSPERTVSSNSKSSTKKNGSLQDSSRKSSYASERRRHSDPSNYTPQVHPSLPPPLGRSKETLIERILSPDEIHIERNDVPFFDDLDCADSDDEFHFTCCIPPYSPRYPPNPRPHREWDPSFLPSGTNIPTSISKPCRRCGNPVYLAELHLSSRGVYHTECYKCCLCGKTLDSWSVAEYKGEVFCKGCYRRNFSLHGCGFGLGAGVLQTP